MSKEQADAVIARFYAMAGAWSAPPDTNQMRADLDRFFGSYQAVEGTVVETVAAGIHGDWVSAPGVRADRVLLIVHGGGFSTGSAYAYRPFASHLSAAANCRTFVVNYRLTPEFPYPAAADDCLTVYTWLLGQGFSARSIGVVGDSSGGGLALTLLARLKREGKVLPAAAVLLSPWADLACTGDSYVANAASDPIGNRDMLRDMAQAYVAGGIDVQDPAVSPVNADLDGFPPVLIHACDQEVFVDDSRNIAAKLEAAGSEARLEIWPDMIHQWHLHVGAIDEAQHAIARLGTFIDSKLA